MKTVTKEHMWVKHVITPVSVLPTDDGGTAIFVDPDQQEVSEDNAAYGCDRCGVALAGNQHTDCEGDPDDA